MKDALYLAGGEQNYIRAEAKYRDFQNRFPTSQRGDYVLFQIANSLAPHSISPAIQAMVIWIQRK